MKTLYIYLNDENVNEGFIRNWRSESKLKNISSQELLTGILGMYDYISNGLDIEEFFDDQGSNKYFFETLYKYYNDGVWTMIDFDDKDDFIDRIPYSKNIHVDNAVSELEPDDDPTDEKVPYRDTLAYSVLKNLGFEYNKLFDVDTNIRRILRYIKDNSNNPNITLDPSAADAMVILYDEVWHKWYLFVINKVSGFFRKIKNKSNVKVLRQMFDKIAKDLASNKCDFPKK